MFITPSPLNTLLWRVVARTEDGYLEGFNSLVADDGPMKFTFHASDDAALAAATPYVPAVGRLRWFADGFVSADVRDETLIITDLRMGAGDNYVFRHAVARLGNPHWHPIPAQRLPMLSRSGLLSATWDRIWSAPPACSLPLSTSEP